MIDFRVDCLSILYILSQPSDSKQLWTSLSSIQYVVLHTKVDVSLDDEYTLRPTTFISIQVTLLILYQYFT